jgi:hypothetical protein
VLDQGIYGEVRSETGYRGLSSNVTTVLPLPGHVRDATLIFSESREPSFERSAAPTPQTWQNHRID